METRQAGADHGAERRPASATRAPQQMEASDHIPPKAPVPPAFGSGGGAALVFRDYASI